MEHFCELDGAEFADAFRFIEAFRFKNELDGVNGEGVVAHVSQRRGGGGVHERVGFDAVRFVDDGNDQNGAQFRLVKGELAGAGGAASQ